jgi:Domain of unknown function (DUF4440)
MPKTTLLLALSTLLIASLLPGSDRETAVLAAQARWLASYNTRSESALAEIEADDFQIVFGDGRVQHKSDQLTNIRRTLPAGAEYQIAVETPEVRMYGNAAVLTGIVTEHGKFPDEHGALQPFSQRSRYTDTWVLQKGRWRVVSSHLSDLK